MRIYLLIGFISIAFCFNETMASTMSYEEMKQEYGSNKTFLQETELPAIIALSFYPELRNTTIRFEYKNISTTMAARPTLSSVFKKDRTYVIYLNNDVSKNGGVAYSELNLKQRIGIIAHELAHVLDFEKRKDLSIISCGILYKCLHSYHKKLERKTDETVINKGLGNELYAFTDYVLNNSNATEKYIHFKKKNYLLPEEIKQRMK